MTPRVEISKRLVFINSASSVSLRFLHIVVLLWSNQYLLFRIPPEEFAIYAVVTAVMTILPVVSEFLAGGLNRYIVAAYAEGDEIRATTILSSMVPILTATSLALLVGGGVFAWHIDHVLTIAETRLDDARLMMALLAFNAAAQLFVLPFSVGFSVRQRFVLLNVIRLGAELIRITLLIVLLVGVSPRVLWPVVAATAANFFAVVVRGIVSRRLVPSLRFARDRFDWATAKKMMAFGSWTSLGSIALVLQRSGPPLVLNELGGTFVDVNCFHVGGLVYRKVRGFATIGLAPAQPAMTAMFATGRIDRLRNTYLQGGRYQMWITLFVACPLIAMSREIIALYVPEKYSGSAGVMVLLTSLFPLIYSSGLLYRVALATARVRELFVRTLLTQLAILILMIYLVYGRGLGAAGAAWAIVVGTVVSHLIILWPLGLKMLDLKFRRFVGATLWPGVAPFLFGLVVCFGLRAYATPTTWFQVGLCAAGGWLAYGMVFVMCLKSSDRNDLKRLTAGGLKMVRGRAQSSS